MRPYTIKKVKSTHAVLTFSKKAFDVLLKQRPEVTSLIIAKLKSELMSLMTLTVVINGEQEALLLKAWGANEQGVWVSSYSAADYTLYNVINAFVTGFLLNKPQSSDIFGWLEMANLFYDMVDSMIFRNDY